MHMAAAAAPIDAGSAFDAPSVALRDASMCWDGPMYLLPILQGTGIPSESSKQLYPQNKASNFD